MRVWRLRWRRREWSRERVIVWLLPTVFSVVLVVVGLRIGQLQLDPPEKLKPFVSDRVSRRSIEPIRGDLLDRRGRVISTTRFGYRLVVDPATFVDPPDEAIVNLSAASGLGADVLGPRIIAALGENDLRRQALNEWMSVDEETEPQVSSVELVWSRLKALWRGGEEEKNGLTEWAEVAGRPKPLIRYLPFSELLDQDSARRVREARVRGVWLERWPVREYPGGGLAASLIGKVGFEHVGLIGVESTLDQRLTGEPGHFRYVRDAVGHALWVGRGDWESPTRGEDIALSLDLELQRIATEEIVRGVHDADAAGGRIVLMDPRTGEILAMVDYIRDGVKAVPFPWVPKDSNSDAWVNPDRSTWPRYQVIHPDERRSVHPALGRNRCVEDVYEPGSTFKPFVWAVARQQGKLPDTEMIRIESRRYVTPYGRRLEDVTYRAEMKWSDVLLYSSNIGMSKVAERVSFRDVQQTLSKLGFGQRTGIGLPGESAGLVTRARDWTQYTQTSVAIGYEVAVTPVQMVRAFSAFARNGELAGTVPAMRLTAFDPSDPLANLVERVYEPQAAMDVRHSIVGVVDRMEALRKIRFPDDVPATYTMFGKSGTSKIAVSAPKDHRLPRGAKGYFDKQYNASFLVAAPVDEPRLVVLAIIDDPGPDLVRLQRAYGSSVAGPVTRRVVERSLRYLGVLPDMPEKEKVAAR